MEEHKKTEATKLTISSGVKVQAERDAGEEGISPSNQSANDTQSATVSMASIGETKMVCPSWR